jgi:ribosomal protein L11 methylase PrmA
MREQSQETITTRGQDCSPSEAPSPPVNGRVAADLASLQSGSDISQIHFTSHRTVFGPFVIWLKKMLRRLLTPILERQLAYNVANARLASYLCEQVEVSKHQQMDVVQTLQVELARQAETVQRLQGELARQVEAVQVLHAELARQLQGFEPRMAKRFVERTQQEIDLQELQKNWNEFAQIDPLWAIITWPEKKGNKWDVEEFFSLGVHDIEAVMNHASSLGIIRQRRRALDFGCGVGRITQALARHFEEVCGIDIAPAMIELAKQYNRYGEKCRYYVNNTDDLTLFTDSSFDFYFYDHHSSAYKIAIHQKLYTRVFENTCSSGITHFSITE